METDILVTMVNDLKRALKKPAAERRWVMLIDTRECIGCHRRIFFHTAIGF